MVLQFQFDSNDIMTVQLTGTMSNSEYTAAQDAMAKKIQAGAKLRVLAIQKNFTGWQKGVDWDDLEFLFEYGDSVTKIAIVCEPGKEAASLNFAGSGFRKAPVRTFKTGQEKEALDWLNEK